MLCVPPTPPLLSPIVNAVPMQLLAYHLAARRGCSLKRLVSSCKRSISWHLSSAMARCDYSYSSGLSTPTKRKLR